MENNESAQFGQPMHRTIEINVQPPSNFQSALERPFSAILVAVAAGIAADAIAPHVASVYKEVKSWFKKVTSEENKGS
jgi:hypothetical protein